MSLKDKWKKFKELSKAKKIISILVVLILVLFVLGRIIGSRGENQPVEVKQSYIPVNAQTVQKQDISTNITLSGKIQADKEAAVLPKTMGRVESIAVKVGDVVKKDQVLFSLDRADLQTTYDQAAAGYALAEAAYELNLDKYEKAKADYEKAVQLYELGAISKTDLEMAEMQASEAVLRTAEAQFAQAKSQYDAVSKTYRDMDVKAPIGGIVTALNVKIGDMATNTAPAATIVDMEKVYVNVTVSEKVINLLKDDQEVLVEIASAKKSVQGKIDSLSLSADRQTGKYELKVFIDNQDGLIKPGMFAKVTIDTATKKDVLVVPAEAIIFHNGLHVVYVVEGNQVQEREVTTGLENGKQSEILSGLAEGEVIVIKGMNYVKDQSEIKIIELDGMPVVQEGEEAQEDDPQAAENKQDNSTQAGGGTKQ
jgi:RND family efflux transporter MFP subunit